jgi:hypothetical protein
LRHRSHPAAGGAFSWRTEREVDDLIQLHQTTCCPSGLKGSFAEVSSWLGDIQPILLILGWMPTLKVPERLA